MPSAADFLRLILADPDADGPRLVYADWLDDQGLPARAEFIRVQCALASLPAGDPNGVALRARAEVLLEEHRVVWAEPLPGLANRWDWIRGFPDVVRLDARAFLARGEELFAAVPVRHVELLDVAGHLIRLAACPLLERLTAMTITGSSAGNAIPKALGGSPHVGRLKGLHLPRNGLTDAAVDALAAGRFGQLTTLDLSENEIGPAGAHTLAAAANLTGLTTLRMQANSLGPDGAAAILTSTRLVNLTALDLARTQCALASLEGIPPLSHQWTVLNLAGNDLGDQGVRHLCGWPLTGLRTLDLSRCGIGDEGAAALADSPNLTGLLRLAVNGNRITEAGKRRLLSVSHFHRMPALELRENWR
jgi:uncharacterized protein (TIGR02996 family)